MQRKREVERNLAALEVQMYNTEGRYLEQTASLGNVAKGFQGYLTAGTQRQTANSSGGVNLFSGSSSVVHDSERIFSQSSSTYRKALQLVKEIEMGGPLGDYGYSKANASSNGSNGPSSLKKKKTFKKQRSTLGSIMDDSETGTSSTEA
jgi:chromatin modification-related protein EAF6